MIKFATWLNKKFLEWQNSTGERQNAKDFAAYLDIKPTTLSGWLNSGITPERENINRIAEKLGPEVYEILGISEPTPHYVREIQTTYNALPSGIQPEFQDDLDKFLTEWLLDHGFERIK